MIEWINSNYVILVICLGTLALGISAAVLGVLNNLGKRALIGDALAHSTLPGVALAFIVLESKNMIVLLIGASVAALVAILLMDLIKRFTKTKNDAVLALVLASFFGLGQILLQFVQQSGVSGSAGLKSFIFGQAATILISDVYFIAIVAFVVLVIIVLLLKQFKLFIFNKEFYQSLGFSSFLTNLILNIMTVVIVVIGIRMVGVILMSALLVAPGVASRQLSNKLGKNLLLAGLFGGTSGVVGTLISANVSGLPTGPVIVVILCTIVMLCLLLSPKKGIIVKLIDYEMNKRRIVKYHLLVHLHKHPNDSIVLRNNEKFLLEKGYLDLIEEKYVLTNKGSSEVIKIIRGER